MPVWNGTHYVVMQVRALLDYFRSHFSMRKNYTCYNEPPKGRRDTNVWSERPTRLVQKQSCKIIVFVGL